MNVFLLIEKLCHKFGFWSPKHSMPYLHPPILMLLQNPTKMMNIFQTNMLKCGIYLHTNNIKLIF